jgi:hypothetical protein
MILYLLSDQSFVSHPLASSRDAECEVGSAAESQGLQMVRPASIVEGVYDSIYERIMSLDIAPGAHSR